MRPEPPQRPALAAATSHALDFLTNLPERRVSAAATVAELRAKLAKPLTAEPTDPVRVINELVRDVEDGILASAGGRFFAWAIGGSLPAALAADWLTSAWDQAAALYACSPAAAIVEEVAGEWLKALLQLPQESSFTFASGCQMAHATCFAAARHELLKQRGWDVERDGLSGAPAIRVLASNRHGSIERAIRLLGIGDANVTDLPLNEQEQLEPETLRAHLENWRGSPLIVLLQAGDLNTGSFDRFSELIPIARRHGAWIHIDGAFGLWAAASQRHRHLVHGIELADSWATDGHKWLNVPYDCGYAFVRNAAAHRAAMSHRAPYLVHDAEARDQIDWNPEWSRRGRGFATYAALRELGRNGVEELVDRCCHHARQLVEGLGKLNGVDVLWMPRLNQGLVRFRDPAEGASEESHDRYTDLMVQRLLDDGRAFFMATTWRGRRALRISVLNWQTSEQDVLVAIEAVRHCLAQR